MSFPAATIGDLHVCSHGGGPVLGPGCPTVLIGGKPAAVIGDSCVCPIAPDAIITGSATVLIGGKPAARLSDSTAHGGAVTTGAMNVLIG
ncbi:PAAR domain-containing protein [Chitinophaga oryzae]|uniref:PAAR domain-containing protein n=1 Tax=Chitinophaga oryzae TaxID=2725414 RepID=A0AAE6ZG81_9BACT|nr:MULTISPECIES: PAAR domain-containing protein [Chitinophaga]QJB32061.1 PAAR domain-containing protein [Chitinophaga oryzae]QJB38538.1 PAAR domain-containing protein [Chitinophaga oryzae]